MEMESKSGSCVYWTLSVRDLRFPCDYIQSYVNVTLNPSDKTVWDVTFVRYKKIARFGSMWMKYGR